MLVFRLGVTLYSINRSGKPILGIYACRDSDNTPKEKYLKLLEFRYFERHILFSQSERKDKKNAIFLSCR